MKLVLRSSSAVALLCCSLNIFWHGTCLYLLFYQQCPPTNITQRSQSECSTIFYPVSPSRIFVQSTKILTTARLSLVNTISSDLYKLLLCVCFLYEVQVSLSYYYFIINKTKRFITTKPYEKCAEVGELLASCFW